MLDHIPHGFVPLVWVHFLLILDGGVRDGGKSNATLLVQDSPHRAGEIEEDCLEEKDEGHPLIVADTTLLFDFLVFRNPFCAKW